LLAVLNHRLNRRGISRSLMLMAVVLGLCVIIPVAMLRAADEKKIDAPTDDLTQVEQKVEAVPSPAVDAATVDIANDGSLSFEGRAMTLDALTNELKIVQCAADEKKTDPPADDLTQVEQKVEAVPPPAVDAVTVDIVNDGSLSFEGRAMTLDTLTNELKTVQRATPNVKAVIRASAGVASAKLNELLLALKQTGVAFLSPITRKSSPAGVPLEVARIHLRLVERELGQALAELARLTKLHSEKLISTSELDQARLKVERLKAESETDPAVKPRAELDLARAELAIAQARLKRILELASQKLVAQSDVEQAEAEFSKAQANLHLAELLSKHPGAPKQNGLEKTPPNQPKKDRLLKILADEIQVAESQAKLARAQHKAGTGTLEESLRAELDVLALKREIAALEGDAAQARDLLGQQMRLLQDLERDTRELRQRGRASEADELKVRRQILLLQRQQAELD
jgi:biopolymer transport protein ExbD